jgi:hypothetical protein
MKSRFEDGIRKLLYLSVTLYLIERYIPVTEDKFRDRNTQNDKDVVVHLYYYCPFVCRSSRIGSNYCSVKCKNIAKRNFYILELICS